jgi:hypothetical protein
MSDEGRVVVRLTNSLPESRTVVLEPWTGEYKLPSGETLELVAQGNRDKPLEVELVDGRIIVYCFGSEGAQMWIFRDGKELTASEHES